MKIFIRIILLICIGVMFQIQLVQKLEDLGQQMMMLGNQPHRGLGALYLATIMQPHRLDYKKTYYTFWLQTQLGNTLLEGARKPVIANQIINDYHMNPGDMELRKLASIAFSLESNRRWKKEKPKT